MDLTSTTFLKQAISTAEHFGFRSVDSLAKLVDLNEEHVPVAHTASAQERRNDALHGVLSNGLNTYCTHKLYALNKPVFFYTLEAIPRSKEPALTLHVFNVPSSIAEAVLIQTSQAIVRDLGHHQYCIRVNSIGDQESSTRYIREVTNYLRKRIDHLPETARELMKDHVLTALNHLVEKQHELVLRSPKSLEYLSDSSRKHFRELIEYLDTTETAYEIDPTLLGHHECYSDALFALELRDTDDQPLERAPLLVQGGRYSEFVLQHTKQAVAAAGAAIVLREKKMPARSPRSQHKTPSVALIQLGFAPKIRSLLLIEELRSAGIAVDQNLASDSLSEQLRAAEAAGFRFVIIIGQKEFVEQTAILRNLDDRTQETLPINALITKLRRSKYVPELV